MDAHAAYDTDVPRPQDDGRREAYPRGLPVRQGSSPSGIRMDAGAYDYIRFRRGLSDPARGRS